MVKRIFFGALILILLMQMSYAENTTLIDSYSYDYIADGTTVTILDQMDTDEKTTITFELNTTPGNVEVSSVLGIISTEQKFFTEGNEIVTLEFNKITSGEKELLIMVYNEDALVAFITNYHVVVDNGVELSATPDSLVVIDDLLYVSFNIETNMQIETSSAKIMSKEGTVYNSAGSSMENNKITYTFAPKESSEYNLYEITVNGYVQEFNESLGSFDLSPISGFKESKTTEGLTVSFSSDCSTCEKEITLLSEEDEYVYNEKINSNSLTISSDILFAMEINGPYKVIINYDGIDYDFKTQNYNYGDFEPVAPEETAPEETQDTASGSDSSPASAETNTTEETPANETVAEEETEEELVEETGTSEDAKETSKIKESVSNLITGFSVSGIKDFADRQKTMLFGGIAIIIILVVLIFMYIRQRKDAYLYEI